MNKQSSIVSGSEACLVKGEDSWSDG